MARTNTGSTSNYFSGTFSATLPLTMACWFNVPLASSTNDLIVLAASSNIYYNLTTNNKGGPGTVDLGASNAAEQDVSTSNTYLANTWNHVAGVVIATGSRYVYLNGIQSAQGTSGVGAFTSSYIQIGGFHPNTITFAPLNGAIAEVAVWRSALTSSDIVLLASGASPFLVQPKFLLSYWPMNGFTYGDEQDVLGGRPLTMFGSMGVQTSNQLTVGWLNNPTWTVTYPPPVNLSVPSTNTDASFGGFVASDIVAASSVGTSSLLGGIEETLVMVAGGVSTSSLLGSVEEPLVVEASSVGTSSLLGGITESLVMVAGGVSTSSLLGSVEEPLVVAASSVGISSLLGGIEETLVIETDGVSTSSSLGEFLAEIILETTGVSAYPYLGEINVIALSSTPVFVMMSGVGVSVFTGETFSEVVRVTFPPPNIPYLVCSWWTVN